LELYVNKEIESMTILRISKQHRRKEKGMRRILVFLISISLILSLSSAVSAGWQLYDDFSSANIDAQKWSVDESSASINIENGEAKFVHNPGHPNDSSWLQIIDNPQNIIGIRTKIRVQSCTGDVRGRAGGWVGQIGENLLWSAIRIRSDEGRISFYVDLNTPGPSYDFLYSLFWASFHANWDNPFNILGETFILEWMFKPDEIIGKTDRYGETVFEYPERVSQSEDSFKGIGTRSSAGDGPCTIYFDDVYVYSQTSSAATNLLLFEE
jgi:hypothetical protein